jgi:hypothetical protein
MMARMQCVDSKKADESGVVNVYVLLCMRRSSCVLSLIVMARRDGSSARRRVQAVEMRAWKLQASQERAAVGLRGWRWWQRCQTGEREKLEMSPLCRVASVLGESDSS